ncbi:MAG: hypothetical protein IT304_00530 [Dehalococcoidia bacterium]|nr:hypothetical protein [Dehalococcoidia bacterium]
MQRVAGVRFREAGRIYYFSPAELELEEGDFVVVETPRGQEIAWVVIAPDQVVYSELTDPRPIVRLATDDDIEAWEGMKQKARAHFETARKKALEMNIPAKITGADYDLGGRSLAIYFTSEERNDLRDLGQALHREFGLDAQFRQIGPRDQAKMVDGYGVCGRRLCCSTWLTNFPSISIKMAKEQDLPLNPSKISGECGRLLCCLSYENDQYREMRANLPSRNQLIDTPNGVAKVISVNVLKQSVNVIGEGMPVTEVALRQIGFTRKDGGTVVPEPEAAPAIEEIEASDEFRQPAAPSRRERGQGQRRQQPRQLQPGERLLRVPTPPPTPPPAPAASEDAATEGEGEAERKRRRRRRGGRNRRRGGGGTPAEGGTPPAGDD